ncbi:hypothetical protein ACFVJH_34765 [Streptomyces decoyicus]|uniref:hypothetical protein n=1 Tax=Streptomyces decoyicus TaxID=249567 RepID=UPI003642F8A0
MSELVQSERMTAREFLELSRAAPRAEGKAGALGIWDLIGNLSSVLSIIGFMQGVVGSDPPPGVTLEELLQHQVVGGQLRNHIAAMPHGTPPLAPAVGFSGSRITGSRAETA